MSYISLCRGMSCADEQASETILDRFVELGGNFFDTADVYSPSEEVIGRWLSKKPQAFRQSIIIATKFCQTNSVDHVNNEGASRKHIFDALNQSLTKLRTNYIDLYQIHIPDSRTPLRETMRALNDLVQQGKVHYIGYSNFMSWQIQKANDLAEHMNMEKFITVQHQYSLLCRNIEWDLVGFCRSERVGILVWSPLSGGWLSGRFNRSTQNPDKGTR